MSDKLTEQVIKCAELWRVKCDRALLALAAIRAKNEDAQSPPFFGDDGPLNISFGTFGNLHLHVKDAEHMYRLLPHFGHIKPIAQWASSPTNSVIHAVDWTDFDVPIWIHVPAVIASPYDWCAACPNKDDETGDSCVGCNAPTFVEPELNDWEFHKADQIIGMPTLRIRVASPDHAKDVVEANWNDCKHISVREGKGFYLLCLHDFDTYYERCGNCDGPIDSDGYPDEGFCSKCPPDVIAHPCSGINVTQAHEIDRVERAYLKEMSSNEWYLVLVLYSGTTKLVGRWDSHRSLFTSDEILDIDWRDAVEYYREHLTIPSNTKIGDKR